MNHPRRHSLPSHLLLTPATALLIAETCLLPHAATAQNRVTDTIRSQNERVQRMDLPNGMTCLFKPDHSAPVVSIQFWVGTGSIHEEEFLGSGLSHAIEHMIFNGTTTRSANELTREIDQAGGRINAYTTLDRTVFFTEIPADAWQVGFDALADSLMHATFPQEQWDQERAVILREFAMGYDDPSRELNKLLWHTVYRHHPYRVPTIGYESVFRDRTRDDLAAFFARHYVPDNMLLVIVGDIDLPRVQAHVRDTFRDFTRKARSPVILPAEPPQLAPREARLTGDYQVSRLTWCYRTVPLTHPDAPALDVLALVAGRGRSSRLVQRIQEEAQLCTSLQAWSFTPLHDGLFGISATFAPEQETELRTAIETQIASLHTTPFPASEVDRARRRLLMDELNELSTMQGQASSIASGAFFAGSHRFNERYLAQLTAITPETLQQVARTYLVPDTRTLALLTPAATSTSAPPATAATPAATSPSAMETLPNGVRVIVRSDMRLPITSACIVLPGGLRTETESQTGITALMADLLTRGTDTRDSAAFASAVDALGASLTPFSGLNSFGLRIHSLASDMPQLIELAADALLHPTFPESEIDKQRTMQTASLMRSREQPMYHAQRQLAEAIHAGHPYARERLGSPETLQNITQDALRTHHRQLLQANQLVLSFAGHITMEEARNLAMQYVNTLPPTSPPAPSPAQSSPRGPITLTTSLPRQQAIVMAGFPGVAVDDPRADALRIIEKAMSGLASTLGESVRGTHGLAYFVGAFSSMGVDPGLYAMYAGTQAGQIDAVIALFQAEATRVRESGLTDSEIERATRQLIASHDMSLQDASTIAMARALDELYGLGFNYADSLPERLRSITHAQIREAAALLDPAQAVLSIVRPESTDTQTP